MAFDLDDLLGCLDLRACDDGALEGRNYDLRYPRVFGGQLLGQGVRALHEAADGKQVKSFTQYFPREGKADRPVRYAVDTVHAGRSFATCSVTASQDERVIGLMTASLHAPEPGRSRCDTMPAVGGPDDAQPAEHRILPWEVRVVDGLDLADRTTREPTYRLWMRAPALGGVDGADEDWLHQALLAHATDTPFIGTAVLPLEGLSQADAHVTYTSAVTTHTAWFHESFRLTDWLLLDVQSPVLGGGRSFGTAHAWSAEGRLVASIAQESLVRFPTS